MTIIHPAYNSMNRSVYNRLKIIFHIQQYAEENKNWDLI